MVHVLDVRCGFGSVDCYQCWIGKGGVTECRYVKCGQGGPGGSHTAAGVMGVGASDPVAAALASVQAQVLAQGGNVTDAAAAGSAFTSSYTQLAAGGIMVDGAQALSAAQGYALNLYSPGAAVTQVTGLIGAVSSGSPIAVVSSLGVIVAAAAVALGASTGVGAAIVAGAALIKSVVDQLFSGPAPQANICGSSISGMSPPPTFTTGSTGCVGTNAAPVPPPAEGNDTFWRRFPNRGHANDSVWFTPPVAPATFIAPFAWNTKDGPTLTNAQTPAMWVVGGYTTGPAVYGAWPEWYHIECEFQTYTTIGGAPRSPNNQLWNFFLAYFTAWKANREYGLNGIQPASDAQVLDHVLRLWNRAHEPGTPAFLEQRPTSDLIRYGTPCPSSYPVPYVSTLVDQVVAARSPVAVGQTIQVNLGPLKNVAGVAGSSGAPWSATKKVLVGTGIAAGSILAAGTLYALMTKRPIASVYGGAWRSLKCLV